MGLGRAILHRVVKRRSRLIVRFRLWMRNDFHRVAFSFGGLAISSKFLVSNTEYALEMGGDPHPAVPGDWYDQLIVPSL